MPEIRTGFILEILSRLAKKKKLYVVKENKIKVAQVTYCRLMFKKEEMPSIKEEIGKLDELERESFSQKQERWEQEEKKLKEELVEIEKKLAKMSDPAKEWVGVIKIDRYFELSERAAKIRNQLSGLSPNPIRDRFMRHGRSSVQRGDEERTGR